jgi:DNA polymerase-3 subunit gamma/tau
VAQPHVTRTLENAIRENRLASAYLFTGPRGVGKTTMARILGKAINCERGMTPAPCDECSNCRETAEGRSMDVFEIDGASNRGIDEVRNLRENARYAPAKGRYKIYIIDEVHMLTEPAFNALLKTLEEPPPHALFVFATTEVNKVPATILSRCQRFDFRRVPLQEMVAQLRHICEHEKISIDEPTLFLIAQKAEGSLRDSQSLLDQVISFCGQKIVHAEVAQLLGIVDHELFFECTEAIAARDAAKGLALVEKIYDAGYDLGEFLEQFAEHLNAMLTTRITGDTAHLIGLEAYAARYMQAAQRFSEIDALRHLKIVLETQERLRRAANARLLLETALLKMIRLAPAIELGKVLDAIQQAPAPASSSSSPPVEPAKKKPNVTEGSAVSGYRLVPQVAPAKPNGGLFGNLSPAKILTPVVEATPVPVLRAQAPPEVILQEIQAQWARVVERVSTRRISLGTFLGAGMPRAIIEGTLEVVFAQENGFHINSINNQRLLIQECIQDATGHTVRIICRRDETGGLVSNGRMQTTIEANGRLERGAPQKTLEAYYAEIPALKDVVEALDGELIRR